MSNTNIPQEVHDLMRRGDFERAWMELARRGLVGKDRFLEFKVGDVVYIEIVKYWIGEITYFDKEYVGIKRAVWIASTGRFNEAFDPAKGFKTGGDGAQNAEWEQMGDPNEVTYVRRDAIVTLRRWYGPIPTGTNS